MIGTSLKIGSIGSKQTDFGKRDKAIHAHDRHAQPKTICLNRTDAEIFRILT